MKDKLDSFIEMTMLSEGCPHHHGEKDTPDPSGDSGPIQPGTLRSASKILDGNSPPHASGINEINNGRLDSEVVLLDILPVDSTWRQVDVFKVRIAGNCQFVTAEQLIALFR